jgi:hypothetical protein
MLEQAIIDANALRESAIKNAESMIIEKYSDQIKEAVNTLLEADEDEQGMDPSLDEIPLATASDLPDEQESEVAADDEPIVIDLPQLKQRIQDYEAEMGSEPEGAESHDEVAAELEPAVDAAVDTDSPMLEEDEDLEINEELLDEVVDEILEKLTVDVEPQKTGHLNVPEKQMEEFEDMELAHQMDSEVREENDKLKDTIKKLEEALSTQKSKTQELAKESKKYLNAVLLLKEKVETVNVSNAKLLYINKTLESDSLNERQRRKVVEAISKAGSPKEAKIIFETLQSTVGSTEAKASMPKSLSEAVSRNSSLILNSQRKENKNDKDIFSERMQRLAGINKKENN